MDQAEIDRLLMKPTGRKRLGKYVLLGRLGHGGMGKIYLAYLPGPAGIEKLLVIKRLHSHLTGDTVLVGNFLDEARLSMVLSHPNIVHTYDVGEVAGRYFMVMEYIDGQNLGVVLRTAKRSGRYPESHVWGGMFVSVLEALHAAHTAVDARGRALNIIHRDISPQNILITYEGVPKLVDFGIAKAAMRINETDAGVLKGKYAYMSPEQCQSEVLDPRSDIFAAGIVLWECLAGRRLYKSDSVVKSVERILHEAPIPPSRVNADCDAELSKVVVKALQKNPKDRFGTAEEFRDALDEAVRKQHHYRSSQARALMHDLFHDVMDHQRQILDACLSSAESVTDDDDHDNDVPHEIGVDGESDVHVPPLDLAGEVEPTTPSAHYRSPLVTHEEPALDEDLPKTKGARPRVHSDSVPHSARARPDDVTVAQPAPTAAKKSRTPLIAAALALVFIPVCGLAVVFGVDTKTRSPLDPPSATQDSDATTTPPRDTAPGAGVPSENLGTGSGRTGSGRSDPAVNPRPPPDDDTADDKDDDRRNRTGRRRSRATKDKPKSVAKEPERAPERTTTETKVVTPADPPPPKVDPKVEAPVVMGTLTLDTIPWTRVYLGKKFLGNTPLVGVDIPVGRQVLRLVNKDEGIDSRYEANIVDGKPFRARLGLK